MIALSVLTCPSRPQYLRRTLAALDIAGAKQCNYRFVMSDGMPEQSIPWVTRIGWRGQLGARAAMWSIFRYAHRIDVDWLIYCEDDIVPAPNAVERILRTAVRADQALVSFFDAKEFPGANRAVPGILDVPVMGREGLGLFGACCLLLPRRTIDWALRSKPGDLGMPDGADQALSWALRDSPWPVRGVSVPSLVEHVGDESSMGHASGQRAAFFTGAFS